MKEVLHGIFQSKDQALVLKLSDQINSKMGYTVLYLPLMSSFRDRCITGRWHSFKLLWVWWHWQEIHRPSVRNLWADVWASEESTVLLFLDHNLEQCSDFEPPVNSAFAFPSSMQASQRHAHTFTIQRAVQITWHCTREMSLAAFWIFSVEKCPSPKMADLLAPPFSSLVACRRISLSSQLCASRMQSFI